jgi:anti-anti-sigma factor
MDLNVKKEGDVFVVDLFGYLDFESTPPFEENCLSHLLSHKVVFNLGELSFVGSCGITSFVDALVRFHRQCLEETKFCGLSSEFRKIFSVKARGEMVFYEDVNAAILSYSEPHFEAIPWTNPEPTQVVSPEVIEPKANEYAYPFATTVESPDSTPSQLPSEPQWAPEKVPGDQD